MNGWDVQRSGKAERRARKRERRDEQRSAAWSKFDNVWLEAHGFDTSPNRDTRAKRPRRVFTRDGGCLVPGCLSTELTVDHVVPKAGGGWNGPANSQTLCVDHNRRKGHLSQAEFQALVGVSWKIPVDRMTRRDAVAWYASGTSGRVVATALGVHPGTVTRWGRAAGIRKRPSREGGQLLSDQRLGRRP